MNVAVRMCGVHIDVTKHKLTEERLTLIAKAYEYAQEGIFITDADQYILEVNDAFVNLTGYSREQVIGKTPAILNSGVQSSEFYRQMWLSIKKNGHWSGQICNRHKSGRLITEALTISTVISAENKIQNYIAIFSDITQVLEHQEQIKKVTYFDLLTSLPNQKSLIERLDSLIASQQKYQQLAIIHLDIDNLKVINKKYGHKAGDQVIINTVERIKLLLKQNDILSCIGGNTFVIVTKQVTLGDYDKIFVRLKDAINDSYTINGTDVNLSASLGIAFYPGDGNNSNALLRNSAQALFKAKLEGKDNYQLFDMVQNADLKAKHEELRKIKKALQNKEFVLHYQPKIDMRNGDLIGVEALLRWQDPERGMVYPDNIFPLVADHILNIDIGEWVIEAALKQLSLWSKMHLNIPISVNIDGVHLQQKNFIQRLKALLASYPEVTASSLELEILETNSLEDVKLISSLLKEISTLGIKSSLDDFGTGYSSLTYLKQLPVDLIKIDQSFIRDMLLDAADLAIIKGIVSLADALKTKVIAEGVETIKHVTALLSLNCYLGQGYFIAKPMPTELMPQWLDNWKERKALFLHLNSSKTNLGPHSTKKGLNALNIEILQAAVMDSRDGITIADLSLPNNPLIFVNPAFERITGYSFEDIQGKNCRYLQGSDKSQEGQLAIIRNAIKHAQPCLVTLRNYRKDGSLFWNELSISPIFDAEGRVTHYLGIQKDVTEKVLIEERMSSEYSELKQSVTMLEYLTNIDPLTGIHNRRYLEEQLKIQWNIAKREKQLLTVFMLDIDHFKKYNDTYGHPAGDEALKSVAKVLGSSFLKATDFVARYGGEEFIILTIAGDPQLISEYADSVVKKVAKLAIPHSGSEQGVLTISLGFKTCQPSQEQDYTYIVKKADEALYNAKASGRNKTVDYSTLDTQTLEKPALDAFL